MNGASVICVDAQAIARADDVDYEKVQWIASAAAQVLKRGGRPIPVAGGASLAGAVSGKTLRFVAKQTREQVLSMLGTPLLLQAYRMELTHQGVVVAEAHVTRSAFAMRDQYFLVRDSINALIGNGVVPV